MCDIYTAACVICGKGIEMHLADYATGQDEVEIYCGWHRPSLPEDVVKESSVWEYVEMPAWVYGYRGVFSQRWIPYWTARLIARVARFMSRKRSVVVRPLTENSRQNASGNHPNQSEIRLAGGSWE